MFPPLFWFFAALMLLFGILVVVLRNPVSSALSLVVSFLALAGLYLSLDAFFLGVIQVLVYAGAVMVLFLFIIMLLDLKAEGGRRINRVAFGGGLLVVAGFLAVFAKVLAAFPEGAQPMPPLGVERMDDVRHVGMTLFTHYNLPLQVVGALVLAATIGVVILSKRELK